MPDQPVLSSLRWCVRAAALPLFLCAHDQVLAASRSDNPIIAAVKHGDCKAAARLLATGVDAHDDEAIFLGGRMLDEGICLRLDSEAATRFFEAASSHGHRDGGMEFAAKIGLGDGVEQNFERAGEVCRTSGLDPQGQVSSYSLGYACTLRAVAGKLIRVTLPSDALRPHSGDAVVEFNPASTDLRVKSAPKSAAEAESGTGTNIRHRKVQVDREIQKAWDKALARVPKPDLQKLDSKFIELPIDFEAALEGGADQGEPVSSAIFDASAYRPRLIGLPGSKGGP
jgi:hypothetical protein